MCALAVAALVALLSAPPVASQAEPAPESVPGTQVVLLPVYDDAHSAIGAPPRPSPGGEAPVFTMNAQVSYASSVPGQPFPTGAITAVQAAIDQWRQLLTSSVTVTIEVNWITHPEDVLAGAGPTRIYKNFDNAPVANTYYPSALAEALAGHTLAQSDPDVRIDIKNRTDWSYRTDGVPVSGRFDLMTTIMHELGHGWGYLGTMDVSGGRGKWGLTTDPNTPDIYDRFTEDNAGTPLLSYTNNSTALAAALQSNNLYFDSVETGGSGDRFRLFAPTSWLRGSSYAHANENTYGVGHPESLMTPYINRAEIIHSPGPKTLCLLEALGWEATATCPPSPGPPQTVVQGATWYSNGTTSQSGPASSVITAYAGGAAPAPYKLVTGNDGGTGQPCRFDVQAVNTAVRVANSRGFIPYTSGVVNRAPGTWQVCFRQEGAADPLKVTLAGTFTVTA